MRLWIALAALVEVVMAMNVLVFIPGTTDWEKKPFMRIAQDLTFRNHQTQTFKAVIIPEQRYLVKQKVHGARELSMATGVPKELYERLKTIGNDMPFTEHYDALWYNEPSWTVHRNACDTLLNSDLPVRLREEKLDVALVHSGDPCQLAVVWALNVPYVYFDTEGLSDQTATALGLATNPALYPSSLSTLGRPQSVAERWANVADYAREWAAAGPLKMLGRMLLPRARFLDQPVERMFAEDYEMAQMHPDFPSVSQMISEAALVMVNSDPVVEWAGRPTTPNLVFVGGQQAEHPKPLFPPYNTTNAKAKSGVIVFSLGTVANSSAMPDHWRQAFLETFELLSDFQIYWLTSTPDETWEVPPNVNRTLFMPQLDILASEEARLLITNGGMNSIMEAVSCGVPILGLPLYGPNYANLRKVEARGAAKIIDKKDISTPALHKAIKELTSKASYRHAAVRMARAMKDRPLTPYETLIYWLEYVGRNRGAPLLKQGPSPSLLSSLYLDVVVGAVAVAWAVGALLRRLLAALLRPSAKATVPIPARPRDAKGPREERKKRKATKAE